MNQPIVGCHVINTNLSLPLLDDLDAFNDETFGGPLEVGGDWEQNHEQLAKLEEMEFGGEIGPVTEQDLKDNQGIKGEHAMYHCPTFLFSRLLQRSYLLFRCAVASL